MDALIADGLASLSVRVDSVHPMPGNPRVGDVEAVKRSLVEFGQRKPIVAMADGTITAGHHLHAAAVALGWQQVAVLFVDEVEAKAKAWSLADNRTGDLGRYDNELLAASLVAVRDADDDLLAATSYSSDDVDDLLAFLEGPTKIPGDPGDPDGEQDGGPKASMTCPSCGYVIGGD